MKITELFRSIQGEGIHTGKMASFVRLAGCNLHCDWCDTKFSSWQLKNCEDISVKELIKKIKKLSCKLVIITGGEPLVQIEELILLTKRLKQEGFQIHIETNGTIFEKRLIKFIDFWSFSPKLKSSHIKAKKANPKFKTPYNIKLLKNYLINLNKNKYQLKFIVSGKNLIADLKDVNKILEGLSLEKDANVIIQPEGLTNNLEDYAQRGAELAEKMALHKINHLFKEYINLRLLIQTHKIWWMNKRKV